MGTNGQRRGTLDPSRIDNQNARVLFVGKWSVLHFLMQIGVLAYFLVKLPTDPRFNTATFVVSGVLLLLALLQLILFGVLLRGVLATLKSHFYPWFICILHSMICLLIHMIMICLQNNRAGYFLVPTIIFSILDLASIGFHIYCFVYIFFIFIEDVHGIMFRLDTLDDRINRIDSVALRSLSTWVVPGGLSSKLTPQTCRKPVKTGEEYFLNTPNTAKLLEGSRNKLNQIDGIQEELPKEDNFTLKIVDHHRKRGSIDIKQTHLNEYNHP